MGSLPKSVAKGAIGLVVVLGWWTLRGPGEGPNHESAATIPAAVWDGGAGSLSVRVETSTAAQMRISFQERDESADARSLETSEDVEAGSQAWSVDVPAGVGGYVELGAVEPQPGDTLSWEIEVNGQVVDEQSETLEEPLGPGYAFFLQSYFEDYASGTFGDD
jgi:hypothetical protein